METEVAQAREKLAARLERTPLAAWPPVRAAEAVGVVSLRERAA